MHVPIVDLKAQYLSLKKEIDSAIRDVIESSSFILGKAVSDFEKEFARMHNAKHCIAVGSGTEALHIALWAIGIKPEDEVITVPFTFIATVEAISLLGAKPVFVDIDSKTYTIDVSKIESAITTKTRAILPVHLYGQPAKMDEIREIANRYNLDVVEDSAQSHLAKYNNQFVGQFGDAACFSFYPSKNLGAFGEAGAVITNDDKIASRIRQLRDHGQTSKYRHELWGHNYRMDGIQGAVLGVKLKYLAKWTERRRQIANMYNSKLKDIGDIVLPQELPNVYHVYHLYVICTKKRNELQNFLANRGIATAIHYPIPLHLQPVYSYLGYRKGDFPISEKVSEECISLPIYAEMTDGQVEYVIEQVQSFYK